MKTLSSLVLFALVITSAFAIAGDAQAAVTLDRQWQVPRHDPRQTADDVAVSDDGTVFVAIGAKRYEDRAHIWKYSEAGEFKGRFPLKTPWVRSIAVDPDGSILVVGNGVHRYRPDGKLIQKWKAWGDNRSPVYGGGGGISIDRNGDVYVAAGESHMILRLDRDGRIKKQYVFREKSGRPREFYDVAVAPDGSVYGTDDSRWVHHFAANGKHLGKFGGRGARPGRFEWSYQISVGPDGTVYVMDDFYSRVQAFDPEGGLLDAWGGDGQLPGSFSWAIFGMYATGDAVYLLEANGRLQRFAVDSQPPMPAPIFTYRTMSWHNPVKAGGTARLWFRARNLGLGPATGVRWCVPRSGKNSELIVDKPGCRNLGTIAPRSNKVFGVRVKAPTSKRRLYRVEIQVTSDQTGPGPAYSDLTVLQARRR